MSLPFWNRAGDIEKLDGIPSSVKDWVAGELENLDNMSIRELLNHAGELLHHKATSASLLSNGINLTLLVNFGDLESVIVRRSNPVDDPDEQRWRNRKFDSETHLLRWLQRHSDLNVPRLLEVCVAGGNDTILANSNFIIMNRIQGSMLINLYGNLPTAVKERLMSSYADVMLKMFSLDVPQKIGSLSPGLSLSTPSVAPKSGLRHFVSADRVFYDIKEFFDFLFLVKRHSKFIGEDDVTRERATTVLNALQEHIHSLLAIVPASLLRIVLVHDDPNFSNILIDESGTICGIVDWEFHSLQPAILAAGYPPWLDYDGCEDPRFCPDDTWWLESREESKRLCGIFEEIVKRNPEYYAALTQGVMLRSTSKWLIDMTNDYGCDRLRRWMDEVLC